MYILPLQVTLAVLYAFGLLFVAFKVYGYLRRSGRSFCTLPVSAQTWMNSILRNPAYEAEYVYVVWLSTLYIRTYVHIQRVLLVKLCMYVRTYSKAP